MGRKSKEDIIKEWIREQAIRNGSKGGKARLVTMTPERRREIARKAIQTRWAKARNRDEIIGDHPYSETRGLDVLMKKTTRSKEEKDKLRLKKRVKNIRLLKSVLNYGGTGFVPRDQQLIILADLIRAYRKGELGKTQLAILPTGYGKTILGLMAFLVLRQMGLAKNLRLLITVPSDNLRSQYKADTIALLAQLKIALKVAIFGNEEAKSNDCLNADIVITTYHTLITKKAKKCALFDDVMKSGVGGTSTEWMAIFEECHRLSEEGEWAKRLKDWNFKFTFLMSATPRRGDSTKIYGLRYHAGKPFTRKGWHITYAQAVKQGFVRDIRTHKCLYITTAMMEGELIKFSTSHLHESIGESLDDIQSLPKRLQEEGFKLDEMERFEAKHQIRYRSDYLDPLFEDVFRVYDEKKRDTGLHHQIIVFAMSVRHAQSIVEMLNRMRPNFADYMGTSKITPDASRTAKENNEVLKKFKEGSPPCLVQVARLTEGFNHPPASILVFVHMINDLSRLMQEIGRGCRRWDDCEKFLDIEDVFASSDHSVIGVAQDMCPDGTLSLEEDEDGTENKRKQDPWPQMPRVSNLIILDNKLEKISREGMTALDIEKAKAWFNQTPLADQIKQMSDEDILKTWRMHPAYGKPPSSNGQQSLPPINGAQTSSADLPSGDPIDADQQREEAKNQFEKNLSKVAHAILHRLERTRTLELTRAMEITDRKKFAGRIKVALHKRFNKQHGYNNRVTKKKSSADDYRAKNEWLKTIAAELDCCKMGEFPEWLLNELS